MAAKLEVDDMVIDARGMLYRELNERINEAVAKGVRKIRLVNVNGQRYIADGLKEPVEIEISGTPGDDLGCFMNGPRIVVKGSVQDGVGNTMNAGKIVIHGDARDIVGHSMRGGTILVKGDVGYRVGIHMKEYKENFPVIVAGGTAGDFLGEYMAGGRIVILGLGGGEIVGDWLATGIHGGVIYIRGKVPDYKLGVSAKLFDVTPEDKEYLRSVLKEFCESFGYDLEEIMGGEFAKVAPLTHRPFGKMYAE